MGFHIQQLPDGRFLGMLRAGRIARRGTNALIIFADQLIVAQVLMGGEAPDHLTHPLMQILGEGFGQTIGHRFNHDLVVIVVLRVIRLRQCVLLKAAGHGESAQIVRLAARLRRDIIRQTVVGEIGFLRLLTQMMADGNHLAAALIAVNFNIVPDAVGREDAYHTARRQRFLRAEAVQHSVGVGKQTLRLFAYHFIFKNARIFARQRPGHKERRPVDVVAQRIDAGRYFADAETMRRRRRIAFPVDMDCVIARHL